MQRKNIANLAIIIALVACCLVLIEVIFGIAFITSSVTVENEFQGMPLPDTIIRVANELGDANRLVPMVIALILQLVFVIAFPVIAGICLVKKGGLRVVLVVGVIFFVVIIAMSIMKNIILSDPHLFGFVLVYFLLIEISSIALISCVLALVLLSVGLYLNIGEGDVSKSSKKIEFFKKLQEDGDITEDDYKILLFKELGKMSDE